MILFQKKSFSPRSWFKAGEQGAWFDPSDLTTLFQDAAGTIPVTAVEQPVGKMLDKSGRNNHASQATAGNRPILSARVNLLTATENSSIGWTQDGALPTTNLLTASAGSSAHGVYQGVPTVLGTPTTCFFDVKQGTHRYIQILYGTDPTSFANFDLQTGLPGTTGTSATSTMTDIGGGIYRCRIFSTSITATATVWIVLVPSASATRYQLWTALGTETVNVYKADLRPTNSGSRLPAYQQVNTSTDYDTVGFPFYLKCNGTSSAMATGNIDFTATDKMTVVTGVRKLSDASVGGIIELSVNTNTYNGSFYIFAPANLTPGQIYLASKGTINVGAVSLSSVPPLQRVITLISSISTPLLTQRLNGSQVDTNSTSQGTGNYGNYPLYLFARNGTTMFFNGQFYGAIIRGAQSDAASISQNEQFMAQKTGISF